MAEFIELSDDTFNATLSSLPFAVVDYYATWCGACRLAANMFLRVADSANLPIFKIDAEKNPNSREGVEIINLPTLAVFKNGQPVASLCTTKEESLREFLASHGANF
jgi:thioredoxin 1